METLPCSGCKGLCCGPVQITKTDFNRIKRKVKSMPVKLRSHLENQTRYSSTCIFYDIEKDRCGIHSARPGICRLFGYHKQLVCFRKPELATKTIQVHEETPAGILSIDYTWKDFR